jgi:hypothetical protein
MASNEQSNPRSASGLTVDAPMSGAQLQALQKQLTDKLAGIVKDVELRKWSIDQACGLAGSAIEFGGSGNAVELARAIHTFLTEAATPAKQEGAA